MLLQFNDDILDYICSYLSPTDMFNLSIANKALHRHLKGNNTVYKNIYFKVFPELNSPIINEALVNNWYDYFKFKVNKSNKFFTWGNTELGRLGYLINQVPQEKLTINKNVCIPNNVPNFNPVIIWNIACTGFSFIILTNKGLFFTGNDYKRYNNLSPPGPPQLDFKHRVNLTAPIGIFPRITYPGLPAPPPRPRNQDANNNNSNNSGNNRTSVEEGQNSRHSTNESNRQTNPNLTRPPNQIPELREFQSLQSPASKPSSDDTSGSIESNFVTKLKVPKEGGVITTITSGRLHFVALDDKNKLFSWDAGNSSLVGVRLLFPDSYEYLNDGKTPIQMIKCGWNLSSCYVDGKIIVWYLRAPLTQNHIDNDMYESTIKGLVIPIDNLVDYHLGNDFIIILKKEGCFGLNLHVREYFDNQENYPSIIDIPFDEFVPMQNFNNYLAKLNAPGYNYKFFKVTGCYNSFAIFVNNNNDILFGNKSMINDANDDMTPTTFDLPPNIIDLQMGDYHYLALTADGQVYSWGLQSNHCGCLGLGNLTELADAIQDRNNITLKKPTRINSPTGKWSAITASGWHSAGVCLE